MLCAHCRRSAATPDGTLCSGCAAAAVPAAQAVLPPQPAAGGPGPLPVAPPLTAASAFGPPGTGAYGNTGIYGGAPAYPPHGPAWLRSPVGLGKAAAVALGAAVVADLFALWSGFLTYDVADRLVGDVFGAVPDADIDRADALYRVAGVLQVVALVVAGVLFLVWFQRVRVNAEVFDPFGHRMKRGWTCWSWFVPVVNLWFPRRIMEDVWDASVPTGRVPHGLINSWWTLWIIALVADRVSSTTYSGAETPEEFRDAVGHVLFADAAHLAAGVLAVLVVLRLTRMQDEMARGGPAAVTA
ncbi:DUF4328 domain-containing protein [Streptomyces sp. MMBL 11-3]|uniref:DUF4328 domain-containing protein n=1 Tax=Streptomyces sp. MMBL 11-3 TaxID=3382639 RepID=UPI0039B4B303